ncbi:MAG: hypothetical protein ABSB59_15970 [Streptosporangiaceae bacterium]|jgi:imidazolonepropionase-like amidohydrolase
MTTPIGNERGRLIALRAAWLFDGTGGALVPDPMVLIDGTTIAAVGAGIPAPADADILAVDGDPLTDPAALHRIRAVYEEES